MAESTKTQKPKATRAKARRSVAKTRTTESKVDRNTRTERAGEVIREAVYVQLGLFGKIYDSLNESVNKARGDAPKQWKELAKRGEKVQKELKKVQDELQERVDGINVKKDVEKQVDKVRTALDNARSRFQKAA